MSITIEPISWIPEDELQLARLCTTKLTYILEGTLTIGIYSLVACLPDPNSFFNDQFHKLYAHAEVLHTISGKVHASQMILQLRECSAEIKHKIRLFQEEVSESLTVDVYERITRLSKIQDRALAVCDQVGEFAGLLSMDLSLLAKLKGLIVQVVDSAPQILDEKVAK